VLLAFGVDYAILWGILTFLANYIPYLGSLVAVALPVLLCVVHSVACGRPWGVWCCWCSSTT
jgi:predicted PurR-regulated permease PerM